MGGTGFSTCRSNGRVSQGIRAGSGAKAKPVPSESDCQRKFVPEPYRVKCDLFEGENERTNGAEKRLGKKDEMEKPDLVRRRKAAQEVEKKMIEALIGFTPTQELKVGDILFIARHAMTVAFDAFDLEK